MALYFGFITLLSAVTYCQSVDISVDWSNITATSKTTTTLQVVVNALLTRESPIHDQTFKSLGALNANFVRFVPWFPYAKLGVAQLYPPSGPHLCAHLNGDTPDNDWSVSITCPQTSVIKSVDFASWGTPKGSCGNFSIGKCHAQKSMNASRSLCLNKHSCTITTNTATFGDDPCHETIKQFDIQITCSIPYNHSNWDFTLINPLMEDFMQSVNPRNETNKTVINFSTIPNWKYQGVAYGEGTTDSPYDTSWAYNVGTSLVEPNATQVGRYYGNLVSYYKNGGFIDVYGNKISSDYHFNIDLWEVLNEPEAEHHNTPESYTVLYDAIVHGIRTYADTQKQMKFVGMALESRSIEWIEYFLNDTNHVENTPIDYISFHFYAGSASRTNATDYEQFFTDVDAFVKEVHNISAIRDRLSPHTKIDIDEIGVILPGDNSASANPPDIYWNAAAAMFAYLFPQMVFEGVDIIGQSQLMGYPPMPQGEFPENPGGIPPQFASVTEIDWETGVGNARYWLLKMLIDHFEIGDTMVRTTVNGSDLFYAQGFIGYNGGNEERKILIVNKKNYDVMVRFDGIKGGKMYVIDALSGKGPAYIYDLFEDTYQMRAFGIGLLYPV